MGQNGAVIVLFIFSGWLGRNELVEGEIRQVVRLKVDPHPTVDLQRGKEMKAAVKFKFIANAHDIIMAPMLKVRGARDLKRRIAVKEDTEVESHEKAISFQSQKMVVLAGLT